MTVDQQKTVFYICNECRGQKNGKKGDIQCRRNDGGRTEVQLSGREEPFGTNARVVRLSPVRIEKCSLRKM